VGGSISSGEWDRISELVPIACVDVLPVIVGPNGQVTHVGLITRQSPFGSVHCHVGGRVWLGETLHEAAQRHVRESLGAGLAAAVEPEPYFVNQYFRTERPPYGHDPRKQAVSSCFLANFPTAVTVAPTGEAESFEWFPAQELPSDLWPGSDRMIQAAIKPPEASLVTYQAISDRSLSHNELMWNTPVLAMTAMAFLLTIALGSAAPWQRALAASLSLIVALASVQLMAKHSHGQLADSELLHELEVKLGLPTVHARPKSARMRRPLTGILAKGRSRSIWIVALALFALASAVVAVLAVLGVG
jgi:ADP-ribose pyrophosphatase YjhB (NUDIX family)